MLNQMGAALQQGGQVARHAAATAASSLLRALPPCESMEWNVAKYVLYEAAEAVSNLLWDPDPQVPVLQLARSLVRARAGVSDAGEQNYLPCSYLDVPVSPVDEMQLVVIPAGRAWVQEHLDGMPALRKGKD
jgi:hypothetical protein